MRQRRRPLQRLLRRGAAGVLSLVVLVPSFLSPLLAEEPEPFEAARRVDEIIAVEIAKSGAEPPALVGDEEFLRRATLSITGKLPTPEELTAFVLDPDNGKRRLVVDELLASPAYSRNWARYWKEAVLSRAQDQRVRLVARGLEEWLAEQFASDAGWGKTVGELLTATGDVSENGQTGLIFSQMAQPVELAAESARLFLGIQIQCAQCHDHPYDSWSREQFHELAAFFPRMRVQRTPGDGTRSFSVVSFNPRVSPQLARSGGGPFGGNPERFLERYDRDGDGKIAFSELSRRERPILRVLTRADRNRDKVVTLQELKSLRRPQTGRGRGEHFMPDLANPEAAGKLMQPVFFLGDRSPGELVDDAERRGALAEFFTTPENPWFARAFVNRIWAELLGRGFVEPVDDMGPEREVEMGEALDLLADGFTRSGYRPRWLFRTLAATQAFQRQGEARGARKSVSPFAAVCYVRMTADQILDALEGALGIEADGGPAAGRRYRGFGNLRSRFGLLFGRDPSTPPDDVAGTIPQALFLMNSPTVNQSIRAGLIRDLLSRFQTDDDVVAELYLRTLARWPRKKEIAVCREYLEDASSREEALEDILWCLINSTEFLTR